jgi:hypothetical protein
MALPFRYIFKCRTPAKSEIVAKFDNVPADFLHIETLWPQNVFRCNLPIFFLPTIPHSIQNKGIPNVKFKIDGAAAIWLDGSGPIRIETVNGVR